MVYIVVVMYGFLSEAAGALLTGSAMRVLGYKLLPGG
jgi:hypothetical protein